MGFLVRRVNIGDDILSRRVLKRHALPVTTFDALLRMGRSAFLSRPPTRKFDCYQEMGTFSTKNCCFSTRPFYETF